MTKKLKCQKVGVAFGIWLGLMVFLLGLAATLWGWGAAIVRTLSALYIGYDATFAGTLIGTVWAIVDGFVGGYLFAFIYNKL